jgi:two-component sensor histidine kinase
MIGVIARDVTAQRSAEKELDRYRCQLETMVAERTIQLQHEIGERQEVEKNLEVMLREIHHRVKNNLNVMIALIDLQKGAQTDPHTLEVFKDLQTRAYTMALVHESLYRSPNLASVDFSAYLQTLVAYLHSAYRPAWRSVEADGDAHGANVRIVVEAHPASLVIETAIPCGLIVNELVTNALKYAFPPDRQGPDPEVRVGLEPVGPYRPGPWRLTIADNGVGMPPGLDWRSAGTLGLQLVRVLARQLGGTLTLAEDAGGLCWVLAFDERKAHEPRE